MAFDKLLAKGRLSPDLQQARWVILTPKDTPHTLSLRHISIEETGALRGHAWEQIDLLLAARNHTLLNFCNSGSIFHPRQFVLIHDACVYRHPECFGIIYRIVHQLLGKLLARNSAIGTVSNFSKEELAQFLNLPQQAIGVFYNGIDHIRRTQPDPAIIEKLGVANIPYFMCIGSLTKNKNVQLAVDAIGKLNGADVRVVVVGAANKKVFGSEQQQAHRNVIFTGRLSDAEIAALLSKAKAFIFPSIYEGFGLPPIEALALGCPVFASTTRAVKEICGDTVSYFDANDATALAKLIQKALDNPSEPFKQTLDLQTLTWENSALAIARFIQEKRLI